jgi:predicted dinucleotide-binding enzyme
MQIAVIGTGFIGGLLGTALARSGQTVIFGSRHPDEEPSDLTAADASVATVADALAGADVVILAIPGAAVPDLVAEHSAALQGRIVIDATNQMRAAVANSRAALPSSVRYARAFNTLGGENMADPQFSDGPADMFFSAMEDDQEVVAEVIRGVGLRPVYVGEDQEELLDAVFRLWIALAVGQKRGRRLAFRLLEG